MKYDLEWEGSFGYNDIVRQMANAQWHYRIKGRPIRMLIYWNSDKPRTFPPTRKMFEDDPETTLERFNYIKSLFKDHDKIHVTHEYRTKEWNPLEGMYERVRWVNKVDADEQTWESQVGELNIECSDENIIVIWDGLDNKSNVDKWKNPITKKKEWQLISMAVPPQYKVEHISYREPVAEVIKSLSKATLCIGYHGTANTVAMQMWKPQIIATNAASWTQKCSGPWIHPVTHFHRILDKLRNLDFILEEQHRGIATRKEKFYNLTRQDPQYLQSYFATDLSVEQHTRTSSVHTQ